MFVLTDGKSYVMENPMKSGEYLSTTSPVQATEFTYKQARSLRMRKGKRFSWMQNYQMVDFESGKVSDVPSGYKGNAGAFIGQNDFDFDESILDLIIGETNSVLGLAGWDMAQLDTYNNLLNAALSKYDSAEADIEHALQKYKKDNAGKKPQAHKMAKLGYLLDEIRYKHEKIKECMRYIKILQDSITYKYDIGKIKLELSKAKQTEYKGRTEYYKIALEILG